jgi:hypothetical protein
LQRECNFTVSAHMEVTFNHIYTFHFPNPKLKDRLNNHRSDIKLKKNTAISIHFNSLNHECSDLFITPIFDITGMPQADRFRIENDFMRKLDTLYPVGINHLPIVS